MVFHYGPPLPRHTNGLVLRRRDAQGDMVVEQTSYSIGGGFVRIAEESKAGPAAINGAAGVIPAVIRYWLDQVPGTTRERVPESLLTAAAIGRPIKENASVTSAECGQQAEVGSGTAMAAAGLAATLGGIRAQVENDTKIALEHHLGMACDPAANRVQVPCSERNGMGAIKAVAAESLAFRGDGAHLAPLDVATETMRQTGRDMSDKYKKTFQGEWAVNLPSC